MHGSIVHRVFDAGLKLQGALGVSSDPVVRQRLEDAIGDLDATLAEIRATILDLGESPSR